MPLLSAVIQGCVVDAGDLIHACQQLDKMLQVGYTECANDRFVDELYALDQRRWIFPIQTRMTWNRLVLFGCSVMTRASSTSVATLFCRQDKSVSDSGRSIPVAFHASID